MTAVAPPTHPTDALTISSGFSATASGSGHIVVEVVDDGVGGGSADLGGRLAHRGQRRKGVAGELDVVIADHRDVARNVEAKLVGAVQHADGQHVAQREDRVGARFRRRSSISGGRRPARPPW